MEWKDKYPKNKKPAYSELLDFFEPKIRDLFVSFDNEMRGRFKVGNKYHQYMNAHGWAYGAEEIKFLYLFFAFQLTI